MSNLQTLTELLTLVKLSPESVDRILEHDRWKTEAILENNLQIEELRCKSLNAGERTSDSHSYTQEDMEFNSISSYSECNQLQVGKISKTKIKKASLRVITEEGDKIISHMYSHEGYKDVTDADKKPGSIKTILSSLTYYSLCVARLKRWPDAKDKSSIPFIKQEVMNECKGFSKIIMEIACESLGDNWWLYFSGVEFCKEEVRDLIKELTHTVEEVKKISDVLMSPLFTETAQRFPDMNLATLKAYYEMLSGKFIEAGVRTLTLDFIANRPAELDYTDEFAEWSNIYIDHLHGYKEKWKNQLKEIETDTWDKQLKWRKESTSSPTANP